MSGTTLNAGKAGSRRGHGKKAPTPKPRKPSRTLKGTSMAKKAPAKKPALIPVPMNATNAVHGGTPARKPAVRKPKAPIPAGSTIITHGAKLRKPTNTPETVPGPLQHGMNPATPHAKKPKKAVAGQPLVYVDPSGPHDVGANPVIYIPENVKWPGGYPKHANDAGVTNVMRTMITPTQMHLAHLAEVPKGMTLFVPADQIGKPHSHVIVTPSRFVNPFWSDHPFPYDPEGTPAKEARPAGYWWGMEDLQAIARGNAIGRLFGPPDTDLFPYPADTEIKP